jgi:hypothetical protein
MNDSESHHNPCKGCHVYSTDMIHFETQLGLNLYSSLPCSISTSHDVSEEGAHGWKWIKPHSAPLAWALLDSKVWLARCYPLRVRSTLIENHHIHSFLRTGCFHEEDLGNWFIKFYMQMKRKSLNGGMTIRMKVFDTWRLTVCPEWGYLSIALY